jgi:hypothetical protein
MFKKHLLSLTLVWLILVFVCFWKLNILSPEAQMAYQRLMNLSDDAKEEKLQGGAYSFTHQTRDQVSKQILYKKDLHRLQSRLFSDHSELIFDPKGESSELIEHFKELACAMQEKIEGSTTSQPKQYIRYLKAQEAIYSYKTGQLEAEDVEIAHYLIPGLLWPLSFNSFPPLLKGRAQKFQLTIFKEMTIKAQGFQAIFYDWGDE